jgi:hypothetical protein
MASHVLHKLSAFRIRQAENRLGARCLGLQAAHLASQDLHSGQAAKFLMDRAQEVPEQVQWNPFLSAQAAIRLRRSSRSSVGSNWKAGYARPFCRPGGTTEKRFPRVSWSYTLFREHCMRSAIAWADRVCSRASAASAEAACAVAPKPDARPCFLRRTTFSVRARRCAPLPGAYDTLPRLTVLPSPIPSDSSKERTVSPRGA